MDITTETLQAFLDDAWDAAPAGANTLRDQLRTFEKQVTALFRQGSIAVVSKNSASQTYRGPGLGSYTPVQIANAWRQLINLHDSVRDALISAGNVGVEADGATLSGDADQTVYSGMMANLRVVESYSTDVSQLRLPATQAPEAITW